MFILEFNAVTSFAAAKIQTSIKLNINQSINLFICFVLQNEKYTNICEKKKFSKAQEGSEMTIRSSSQLPHSKSVVLNLFLRIYPFNKNAY